MALDAGTAKFRGTDINDGGRELTDWSEWDSAEDFLKDEVKRFHMNDWKGQPTRVILCFEKDTLSTMLRPLCYELHVPYISFHGQLSDTVVHDLAQWVYLSRR